MVLVSYMVRVELAVSGQTVEQSLYVRSEDTMKVDIVYFVQVFSQTIPEVKRNLHNLEHKH